VNKTYEMMEIITNKGIFLVEYFLLFGYYLILVTVIWLPKQLGQTVLSIPTRLFP